MNYLLLLPIAVPMLMGIILLLFKRLSGVKALGIFGTIAGVLTLGTVICVCVQTELSLRVWNMTEGLSIYFKADNLSKLFLVLACLIWIVVSVYSISYFQHQEHLRRYYSFFLFSLGVIMALCEAGNVITFYLCFELMTLLTFPLVLHDQTKEAISGAVKYLIFSVLGAMAALAGIVFLYQYADTFDFTAGGVLNVDLAAGHEQVILVSTLLVIIGFGAKAALFPLHSWLPVAHPVAPAPASALLSGFVVKCGVLGIFRMVYYVVGVSMLQYTWVQYTWIILSLLTIFMGSMLAYREKLLKKRLAYSTVSQLSYILLGMSVLNGYGMIGALLHVVFHAVVKTALFLFAGIVIHSTGKQNASELDGMGKKMPITYVCFTLLSVTLIGIPPTSAFLSKLYLCNGAILTGIPVIYYVCLAVLMVSALLTAGYLLSITVKGFFYPEVSDTKENAKDPDACMLVPVILLTVFAVGMGLYAQPLLEFIMGIVTEILA